MRMGDGEAAMRRAVRGVGADGEQHVPGSGGRGDCRVGIDTARFGNGEAVGRESEFRGAVGARIETSPGGDDDGLAYGAGAQWNLTSQDGIRGDWTRHDYDAGEVDAYSLSYVRSF